MWAALLTVAALSLLISSAFAAYATYLYFFGSSDSAQKGSPRLPPTRIPPIVNPHKPPKIFCKVPRAKNSPAG
jgi:hypothetical protein